MKLQLKKGSTDVSLAIFIQDSSKTDGSGLTGLAYDSSGLVCYYLRPSSNAAQLTLATQTVTGAHSDGGFVEISSGNMPGVYRLDLSDAILGSGVDTVVVMLKGATNMAPLVLEIQLTNVDLNDGVRGGMTALPNAAAQESGGLFTRGTGAGQINQDANGRVDANVAAISTSSDAADKLEASAETIVTGAAVAGTLSTTEMTTDLTEATDDHYKGRIIIWTSGNLKDQATDITAYDGTAKKLTYSAVTEAPAASDTFIIV